MVAMNIFVAVICSAFDEVRSEGAASAFVEEKPEDGGEAPPQDIPAGTGAASGAGEGEWVVPRPEGWTKPSYQVDAIEKFTETSIFGAVSLVLIACNIVSLSVAHHGMSDELYYFLEVVDVIFTLAFDVEMLLKVIGLGFGRYWTDGFNKVDTVVNISCTIGLISMLMGGSPELMEIMGVFRLSRVLRVMRLLGRVKILRELLEVVMGSWVAVSNLCVFILYCLFVFSLFGMHMFGDMSQFHDPEVPWLDEGTGTHDIPRPTFSSFIMAFSTCFLMMTGDRWKVTMYTYMQTTGLEAAVFFIMLWAVCNAIMMNLFVAVIVENFSVAEDEQLEKQQLKYEARVAPPASTNACRKFWRKLGCADVLSKIEDEVGDEGKSYFIFAPNNGFRIICGKVVNHPGFEYFIMAIIAFNSGMIAYEGPPGTLDQATVDLFHAIDICLLVIFWLEFIMRSVSMGFMLTKQAYIADHWNKLDFLVITTALAGFIGLPQGIANLFRLFRLLRPLRLLNKIDGMRVIIEALVSSAGGLFGVTMLGMVFYLMFAILGVAMFGGKFYRCDDMDVWGRADCVGAFTYEAECEDPRSNEFEQLTVEQFGSTPAMCVFIGTPKWRIAQGYSFDNLGQALKTLFHVGTAAGWSECLYLAMDTTAIDQQPIREANVYASLYFICFLFICSFALINLFVGLLIFLFGLSSGSSLQTESQTKWVMMQSLLARVKPAEEDPAPEGPRLPVYKLVTNVYFGHFITGTILANVVIMMSSYYPEPASWTDTLELLNYVCLFIFTVEMILKLIGLGPLPYVKDHWNKVRPPLLPGRFCPDMAPRARNCRGLTHAVGAVGRLRGAVFVVLRHFFAAQRDGSNRPLRPCGAHRAASQALPGAATDIQALLRLHPGGLQHCRPALPDTIHLRVPGHVPLWAHQGVAWV
jgi:hypothetical protein